MREQQQKKPCLRDASKVLFRKTISLFRNSARRGSSGRCARCGSSGCCAGRIWICARIHYRRVAVIVARRVAVAVIVITTFFAHTFPACLSFVDKPIKAYFHE